MLRLLNRPAATNTNASISTIISIFIVLVIVQQCYWIVVSSFSIQCQTYQQQIQQPTCKSSDLQRVTTKTLTTRLFLGADDSSTTSSNSNNIDNIQKIIIPSSLFTNVKNGTIPTFTITLPSEDGTQKGSIFIIPEQYTMNDILWKLQPSPDIEQSEHGSVVIQQYRQFTTQLVQQLLFGTEESDTTDNNINNDDTTTTTVEKEVLPSLDTVPINSKISSLLFQYMICPPGGIAELQAYDKQSNILIGKFGIIAQPGPPLQQFIDTIQQLYSNVKLTTNNTDNEKEQQEYDNNNDQEEENNNNNNIPYVGAIKYMSIPTEYRKKNIGTLALQVISHIQSSQGCNYIVLVADDKSSSSENENDDSITTTTTIPTTTTTTDEDMYNQQQQQQRLVQWYKNVGNYSIAPLLQDLLGSPNGIYGITMIAPTITFPMNPISNEPIIRLPENCTLVWWS